MPRTVYPQKLAEELAERLSAKTGEPYEARQQPDGWAVYAQSEPVEEPTKIRPDEDEEPFLTAVPIEYGEVTLEEFTLSGSPYKTEHEILAAIHEQIKAYTSGTTSMKGFGKALLNLQQLPKKKHIPYLTEVHTTPQPLKEPHASVGSAIKKAGPYEAFKDAHGSGKQNSKKGKKIIQSKAATPMPTYKEIEWPALIYHESVKPVGMPNFWENMCPSHCNDAISKIIAMLNQLKFKFSTPAQLIYLAHKDTIKVSFFGPEMVVYDYDFIKEWVEQSPVFHMAYTLKNSLKEDKLLHD